MNRYVFLLLLVCGTGQASLLFEEDSVLDITLQGPLTAVTKDVSQRRDLPFSLHIDGVVVDVGVRVRGNSRIEHCRFKPLRLNFSSGSADGTVFVGQDKVKLVTHCRKTADYEKNVLEEYAAYRIMNLLSDVSYRTRLVRIRYVDTDDPKDAKVRYGFLIEPDEALAARLGGELVNVRNVVRGMFDTQHSSLVFVFQYVIGNTDWSHVRFIDDETCCHNGRLLRIGERQYYIPYDFDLSGLVNARYAKPQPELRINSVKVRRYRGYCTDADVLRNALHAVVLRRNHILGVVSGLPYLSEKHIESRIAYLDKFFERAQKEDKLLREFERRCL